MSKYIDADFEIAHYTSMTTNPTPDVTEKDKRNSLIILDALRMAKSIDIVRCKECKWYDLNAHECTGEVNSTDHEGGASYSLNFYDDDFCSYGERKVDAQR